MKKIFLICLLLTLTSQVFAFNNGRMLFNFISLISQSSGPIDLSLFYKSIGNNTLISEGCSLLGATNGWCSGGLFSVTANQDAVDGGYNNPVNVVIDPSKGEMYVVDRENNRIQKSMLVTGLPVSSYGWFAGQRANGVCTSTNIFSPINTDLADGWYSDTCYPLMATGISDNGLNRPMAIAIATVGQFIFVADTDNNRIVKISTASYVDNDNQFVGAIGLVSSLNGSSSCNIGTQTGWCRGGAFAAPGSFIEGAFKAPQAIAYNEQNGQLYVVDAMKRLTIINGSTGAIVTSKAFPSALACNGSIEESVGLAVDYDSTTSSTTIYLSDKTSSCISRFRMDQNFTLTFDGSIGKVSSFSAAESSGCSLGKQTDWCNGHGVVGSVQFIPGSGDGEFNTPNGLSISKSSNVLLVTDYNNNRIEKFNLSTGEFVGAIGKSTVMGSGSSPCRIGAQASWCTGGLFVEGDTDGTFKGPLAAVPDFSAGFLYIADSINSRIQRFKL